MKQRDKLGLGSRALASLGVALGPVAPGAAGLRFCEVIQKSSSGKFQFDGKSPSRSCPKQPHYGSMPR